MKNCRFTQILLLALLLSLVTTNCKAGGTELQQEYGDDASYFMALSSLSNGDEDNAIRLLKESAKKGTPLVARRSAEKLATLGSVQERITKYLELYKQYPDNNALQLAVKELFNDEEYARIIQLTSTIDVTTCNNELAYARCTALYEKQDSHFDETFTRWCTERPFGYEQYKLYCKVTAPSDELTLRAAVFKQDYGVAYQKVHAVCDNKSTLSAQVVSDAGKACLYGTDDFLRNAYYFDTLSTKVSSEAKFYAHFYAGRLYDRSDNHSSLALSRFVRAMNAADNDKNYDNALWYYLNTQLKSSTDEAIIGITKYRKEWHDKNYFDDFFDTLSVRLLSLHLWQDFYQVAQLIDGYASDEVVAKYSYIAARLIETGFLKLQNQSAKETKEQLYTRALSSGTDLYYRLVAADRLGITTTDMDKVIYAPSCVDSFVRDTNAETLLNGYADFGFGEEIYTEWQQSSEGIGIDCVERTAGFLQESGDGTNDFYAKSLRIAAKKINHSETAPSRKLMELVYPQNFHQAVKTACERFNLPEYLLYALIRSESFFDPQIVSHAGAVGLTQLMGSTAGDIARKLKIAEYDLNDSETNILFGGYYLEEMRRRLDNSSILALFAYNGGISRVRTWVKSANLEFGTASLPKDLFLEALPFAETREYGRKVISAAALYGYLYYGKTTSEVIDEILQ